MEMPNNLTPSWPNTFIRDLVGSEQIEASVLVEERCLVLAGLSPALIDLPAGDRLDRCPLLIALTIFILTVLIVF